MSALDEITQAPTGSTLFAGADVFSQVSPVLWVRAGDGLECDSADIADFHGHSGYSIAAPTSHDSERSTD